MCKWFNSWNSFINIKNIQKLDDKNHSLTCVDYSLDGNFFAIGGKSSKIIWWFYKNNNIKIRKLNSM